MNNLKFKEENKVRVLDISDWDCRGKNGVIKNVDYSSAPKEMPYYVEIDNGDYFWLNENEIELINE